MDKPPFNAPMSEETDLPPDKGWLEKRFPLKAFWERHFSGYYLPKNLNGWYCFGALACLALFVQIITGIFLAFHYQPDVGRAFDSVEYIMREVPYGWLIRYLHAIGASLFFGVVYLHVFRSLVYGSYQKPRELVWIVGVLLLIGLMAEAFLGYLLPWGQISYWGGQVILNLVSSIPLVGEEVGIGIRGDLVLSSATLSRFFILHILLLPFFLLGLCYLHIVCLRQVGSNNPTGIERPDRFDEKGKPLDKIPFFPYYVLKDLVAAVIFLSVLVSIVCFAPEMGGYFLEYDNFAPADPFKTPEHIRPLWYFTPFYAILRASTLSFFGIEAKFWGMALMGAAIGIWLLLPWLDRSGVRSIRYKGWLYRSMLAVGIFSFLSLGYLGTLSPTPFNTLLCQLATVGYFSFFLAMPWYSKWDRYRLPPEKGRKCD